MQNMIVFNTDEERKFGRPGYKWYLLSKNCLQ